MLRSFVDAKLKHEARVNIQNADVIVAKGCVTEAAVDVIVSPNSEKLSKPSSFPAYVFHKGALLLLQRSSSRLNKSKESNIRSI